MFLRAFACAVFLLSASGLLLPACGGDGESASGEPLLSGEVNGTYGDSDFVAVNGFALDVSDSSKLIALGDGPLNCESVDQPDPPSGINASLNLPSLEVGTYGSVMVNFYYNIGSFEGLGRNAGTVEITASSAESVAGTVSFDEVIDGTTLSLNGSFELSRCPQ